MSLSDHLKKHAESARTADAAAQATQVEERRQLIERTKAAETWILQEFVPTFEKVAEELHKNGYPASAESFNHRLVEHQKWLTPSQGILVQSKLSDVKLSFATKPNPSAHKEHFVILKIDQNTLKVGLQFEGGGGTVRTALIQAPIRFEMLSADVLYHMLERVVIDVTPVSADV